MTEQGIIRSTREWLARFVIAHDICPFAERVNRSGLIRYRVVESEDAEECLYALIEECRFLDNDTPVDQSGERSLPAAETTLLVFAQACTLFDDFLDLAALAEQLLIDQGYEGIYQLATFHPEYCFAGSNPEDPSNYTNRSPFPMLHIIREASIDLALRSYRNPAAIPQRNIALTRRLGLQELQARLAAVKKMAELP